MLKLVRDADEGAVGEAEMPAIDLDEMWANFRAQRRPGGVPVRWIDIDDILVRRASAIKAREGSAMPMPSPPARRRCSTARSSLATRSSGLPRSSG